jgi:hypothetical protein
MTTTWIWINHSKNQPVASEETRSPEQSWPSHGSARRLERSKTTERPTGVEIEAATANGTEIETPKSRPSPSGWTPPNQKSPSKPVLKKTSNGGRNA